MLQNGKVNSAPALRPAPATPAPAPVTRSDLDYLVQIERGMRNVSNLIEEFHAGAVSWATRCNQLENELAAARAEIETLKKGKG